MKKISFWLVLILLTSFVVFFKLGQIPEALYWDEASIGYYGHSLLQYGTDEYGNKFPLYFKSIGDYKYPGYPYFSILPNALFGLNEFSARFVSALSGVFIILIIFWVSFIEGWLPNSWGFRLSALLLTLSSSWFLVFSRTARESNLGLALVMGAFWCLYRYFFQRKTKWVYLLIALVLMIFSSLTYPSYRIFVPLFFTGFLVSFLPSLKTTKLKGLGVILAIAILTILALTLDPSSRLRAMNVFNGINQETITTSTQQSTEVGSVLNNRIGWVLARVYHNKYDVKIREWSNVYISHFDLSYLFVKGNPNLPWYSTPDSGLLPFAAMPPILIGLFYIGIHFRQNKMLQLLVWWLAISVIPGTFTIEVPNPIRQLSAFPAFVFLILIGIKQIELKISKRLILSTVFLSVLVISSIFGFGQFFINREYHNITYTNQGLKEMVAYIGQVQDQYKQVVISEQAYIFFLFWGEKYHWTPDQIKTADTQWNSVTKLGKIIFLPPRSCPLVGKEQVLYICTGNRIPQNSKLKFVSWFNGGEPAYFAFEFIKISDMPEKSPVLPDRLFYSSDLGDKATDGIIASTSANF